MKTERVGATKDSWGLFAVSLFMIAIWGALGLGQKLRHRALGLHGIIGIGIRWNIRRSVVAWPFPVQLKPAWEASRGISG